MAKLLTNELKAILERGRYNKASVNIPNDHKAISQDEQARLLNVANAIGVDFEATEYTFTAGTGKTGDRMIFSPSVSKVNGEAALKWGNSVTPLTSLKVQPTIVESDKRFVLEFDLIDTPGIEDIIEISLVLPKDNKADKSTLTKALRKGALGEHLSETFEKSKSMSELAPGDYLVVGYEQYDYQGSPKWNIHVTDSNGKRLGTFKANSAVSRKLVAKPVITSDSPATLEVGESTETVNGYPVVPAKLVTVEDLALPVFDFD